MSAPASAAASASATFVMPHIFTRVFMDDLFNPTLPRSRTFCLVGFRLFFKDKPMPRTIYFDYNATTPLDPAVRDAMLPFLAEVPPISGEILRACITSGARRGRCWMMPAIGRPNFSVPSRAKSFSPAAARKRTIWPFSARRGCSNRRADISSLRPLNITPCCIPSIIWRKMKVLKSRVCRWIRKAAFRRMI